MAEKKAIKIRPIITIVCDDVRMESNGKPLLIGVYTGGMTLSGAVPGNADEVMNLAVWLWIPSEVTEIGLASFEIKIIHPNPKHQMVVKGQMEITNIPQPTEQVPLTLGPIPLKLWSSGNLQILFKHEDEEDYQTLRIIPVQFNAVEDASNPLVSST